jgi:hypothetical protein
VALRLLSISTFRLVESYKLLEVHSSFSLLHSLHSNSYVFVSDFFWKIIWIHLSLLNLSFLFRVWFCNSGWSIRDDRGHQQGAGSSQDGIQKFIVYDLIRCFLYLVFRRIQASPQLHSC